MILDADELEALDPEANRTIDIEEFVDLDEIDPLFYDSAYYLVPDKTTAKPYALLARAMEAHEQGRHRPLRHARQAVPRRRSGPRTATGAVDDGVRRRGRRPDGDRRARRGSTTSR